MFSFIRNENSDPFGDVPDTELPEDCPEENMHASSLLEEKDISLIEAAMMATKGSPLPSMFYECPVCSKKFKKSQSINRHKCHPPGNPMDCPHCSKKLSSLHSLRNHIKYIHELMPDAQACPHCGKVLKRSYEFTHHVKFYCKSIPPQFLCFHCGSKFRRKSTVLRHIRTSHLKTKLKLNSSQKNDKQRVFACPYCLKEFKWKFALNRHINNVCLPSKPLLSCFYCKFQNSRKTSMERHIKHVHLGIKRIRPSDGPGTCPVCKKVFKNKRNLDRHVKYVCPIKPVSKLQCHYCGHESHYKEGLIYHIQHVHFKKKHKKRVVYNPYENMFSCTTCPLVFSRKNLLSRHLRGNVNAHLWPCNHCSKVFAEEAVFKKHVKRHLGSTHKIPLAPIVNLQRNICHLAV